jgi:hypothetical protein
MIVSTKKYFILAIIGALIIGIGTYLFLTSYFEKVEILVASTVLGEGKKLEEKDLNLKQYYKNSLPEGFIKDKEKVLGKVIKIERRAGDPITSEVFKEDIKQSIWDKIAPGQVLIAIDIEYQEPLAEELKVGSIISIVSTEKEKDLEIYTKNGIESTESTPEENSLNSNIVALSKNIIIVDSQVIVRNLEIIDIRKVTTQESNILINNKEGSYCIFLKCSIDEAPVISRVTKEDKYKIVMEKI